MLSILGGFLLMSLSKIIENNEGIHHKLLGLPLTKNQLRTIIDNSHKYRIESDLFEVYPGPYPLICLDDEYYIRAKLFYKYLSQSGNEYTFELPNVEPIIMYCAPFYHKGVDLFDYGDWVFVKISKLDLSLKFHPDTKIILERLPTNV
jgi:hypothetical protein